MTIIIKHSFARLFFYLSQKNKIEQIITLKTYFHWQLGTLWIFVRHEVEAAKYICI